MKLKQVKEIVSCLRYKDWWFFIRTRKGEMYLQVEFVARDSGSGPAAMQKGRKWFVSKHATESELVFTALNVNTPSLMTITTDFVSSVSWKPSSRLR